MKTYATIAFMLVGMVSASAQMSVAKQYFQQHQLAEGFSTAYISDHLFNTFAALADSEQQAELQELTVGLTGINLLSIDSLLEPTEAKRFFNAIQVSLANAGYMNVKSFVHNGSPVQLMIGGKGGNIGELILLGENFMAIVEGSMELEQIVLLAEHIDFGEMEPIE